MDYRSVGDGSSEFHSKGMNPFGLLCRSRVLCTQALFVLRQIVHLKCYGCHHSIQDREDEYVERFQGIVRANAARDPRALLMMLRRRAGGG